jgi:L-ascorbate metabolism protein UlaG (beta-lactamase superfamily)
MPEPLITEQVQTDATNATQSAPKKTNRRSFLKLTSGATAAGGAAWIGLSQGWTPKFIRERISEIGVDVWKPKSTPTPADWKDTQITASWLGHASVLINFYGLNILTDPVLHSRCGADIGLGIIGPKRRVAPALTTKDLPRIDLVLLSHAHLDHTDSCTLSELKAGPKAVVAHGNRDLLSGTRLTQSTELKWGEKTVVKTADHGDIEIEAFEVKHWGARWRHDTYRGYNGYILRRGGKQIIFGGDTALCNGFAEIKNKGPFELACMPIGAYNPWIMSHCNPEQAVRMANEAGAKYIIPIHHTTFRFGRETYTEPLERFETALVSEKERVALRHAGETFTAA